MRTIAIASTLIILATALVRGGAQAGPPEGEPTATPTPAQILLQVPLSNDEPLISWQPVSNAVEYRLTGTLLVSRLNAISPFCQSPLVSDQRTLTLDESLDGQITEFQLPLPTLPPEDVWFFFETSVQLLALNKDGVVLAAGNVGGIANGALAQCSTSTPTPQLPPTGQGFTPTGQDTQKLVSLFLLVLGLGLTTLSASWIIWNRLNSRPNDEETYGQ